jgi:hypothetical protein
MPPFMLVPALKFHVVQFHEILTCPSSLRAKDGVNFLQDASIDVI